MTHVELPPLTELLGALRVVSIPTRTRFRGITVREAAIFAAPEGPSEFSPFTEYDDAESSAWLAAAIDFGWLAQPAPRRERIEVNATVPAVGPDEVPGILARFPGCRTAKVKVAERGQTLADDVARVRAVREALGPDARVRVDANTGWSVDAAVAALTALAPFDLDYAEQPCASVPELAAVRERLAAAGAPVRIAADESVRKASDPLAVARAGAADLLIVKAQPLGGVSRALDIVREAGLPVVVSSALDTSVGIAMGAQLAAALPDGMLAGACGLGTVALLQGDVTRTPLVPEGGSIPVGRPLLDPDLLDRFAATPERTAWWRERVTRCHALLAAGGTP
ncbi:o-succinylbenzoate synthase [Leucobacter chromiireducens]|uniref:o-succinylbenzoate synthase n=1 Tax=Leucobacter chromiireducens TaxID=283877 RepID=UPI000F62DBCC|nr:o-succinylbenzoate synthase [Leucobacter chromiireducens]